MRPYWLVFALRRKAMASTSVAARLASSQCRTIERLTSTPATSQPFPARSSSHSPRPQPRSSAGAPRVRRRYRELERGADGATPWGVAGLAIRPHGPVEEQIARIEELGARHVLLRLHPWQREHDEEERLARALAERGHDVAFALPQNRDLVRDAGHWHAAVEELGLVPGALFWVAVKATEIEVYAA